jgi:hypothetical protein
MRFTIRLPAGLLAVATSLPTLLATGCSPTARAEETRAHALFVTSDNCMACHNGLRTTSGHDVSFGTAWRASMMANSARDPYWQASVRREAIDHPQAADQIEDECAVCHMPMARTSAVAAGRAGEVFSHLPLGERGGYESLLAADGVSCTMCHQIRPALFGTRASFSGGYEIDRTTRAEDRALFGPFPIESGHTRIMHSATGFRPQQSDHVRQAELCATCHTLYTKARGRNGEVIAEFPEQVPFLEWQHSAYRAERSCISCHMPTIEGPMKVSSVLGPLREGAARHDFRGGNFFILRMLNRYRDELAVQAEPDELNTAANLALEHLRSSAHVEVAAGHLERGLLPIDVTVSNLTGHKLPTAYPSRRVWIHLTVRDHAGATVFESGALTPSGAIRGNDNDVDGRRFEPHHTLITTTDQVQIYESILGDSAGTVTTGLLTAVRYLKDNRLLPRGFDNRTAGPDIAVRGDAADDADFSAPGDRVRFSIGAGNAHGPFTVEVELLYQPVAFRWAENLRSYQALEPRRFVQYYKSMSNASGEVLARAVVTTN